MKRALLAGAVVWLLLRVQGFIPFAPIHNSWTMEEDFRGGKIPSYSGVTGDHIARSRDGILVGAGMPGHLDWRFATSGPFPSTFRPGWEPDLETNSVIRLILPPASRPRIIQLSSDLPLRYTAFNLEPYLKGQSGYLLRFEGQNSILQGMRCYQSADRSPTWLPLVIILAGLFMACPWRPVPLTVCALMALGLLFRWPTFFNYFAVPLEGDAAGFWQILKAWSPRHPFMTSIREPVFIWALAAARVLFGDSERVARFLGWGVSGAMIGCVVPVGRRFGFSFRASAWAALLLAINPFSIFMSVQGYQLELFTLLILLFAWLWAPPMLPPLKKGDGGGFDRDENPSQPPFLKGRRFALLGITAGFLCLLRIQSLMAVIPLIMLAAWRERWRLKEAGAALVPLLFLLLLYFPSVKASTGSYLGHLNLHANYYQAVETQGTPDQAGSLPSVSAFDYLFKQHSLTHLIGGTLKGYAQILFDPVNPFNRIFLNSHYSRKWNWLLLPFFCVGLGVCCLEKMGRWFLCLPLFFLNGLPFLQEFFREPRLLFHVEPFILLIAAAGIEWAARQVFLFRFFQL